MQGFNSAMQRLFQSTPSVWRETPTLTFCSLTTSISIHSLRVEGDKRVGRQNLQAITFQSTPSVWRETHSGLRGVFFCVFQSTPSVWRETLRYLSRMQWTCISIHSLRVEGDCRGSVYLRRGLYFNPLPPCGGRLQYSCSSLTAKIYFTPLPPCGGRRKQCIYESVKCLISIHSLRVEGDISVEI